jgi:hypothetical protein
MLAFLLLSGWLTAQGTQHNRGTVHDSSGAVVPGLEIIIVEKTRS